MAKHQPKIRLDKRTKTDYAKQVKNTKAKIRRVQKNYGIDLSNEIKLPSLEDFSTRKEYNEWKTKVESFRNRANQHYQFEKNEYGVVASKARLKRIEKKTKEAQKVIDEINAKTPITEEAEQRMLKMARPNILLNRPMDFNFSSVRSEHRLRQIESNMFKKADPEYYNKRTDDMRNNFVDVLKDAFNSDAKKVIKKLMKLPLDDFLELFKMYPDTFDFDLYYVVEGVSYDSYLDDLNKMELIIDDYNEGKVDMDLKDF